VNGSNNIEVLLRELAPRVLGALMRRFGNFADAEDAVQEAMLAAVVSWPDQGVPERPDAWLIRVAARKLTDHLRSELASIRREVQDAVRTPADELLEPAADGGIRHDQDDSLVLMMLCCHPALRPASQIALTLRAVGGLTTAEIAHAFLVPESTMAQRIRRAKSRLKQCGAEFRLPTERERRDRLRAVMHVLYLMFNEGYTASSGDELVRGELTGEALRLTRMLHTLLPDDGEVSGLLALMLLTEARRPARSRPDESLIPLAEQDRTLWQRPMIDDGLALITDSLARSPLGPYQIQAAIAAVHAEAPQAEDTDWRQIVSLYGLLQQLAPSPMVSLNQAVAVAMVAGPRAALALLQPLDNQPGMPAHHRLHAVRAHLLEMAGDHRAARESYQMAARLTTSIPEQRYLHQRAARLSETPPR
jgi:RNA polymerase sigma factor (sigma-70 family)